LTDSCTLCNVKLNDTDSGCCSNRAVGHQTTIFQALLQITGNVGYSCHGWPAESF